MPQRDPASALEAVNALANVIIAAGVVVALLAYLGSERTARVEQTFKLIEDLSPPHSAEEVAAAAQQFKAMTKYFPARYEFPLKTPLPLADAQSLLAVARHPERSEEFEKYDTARKHLNALIPVAVAYVHGLGDPAILADRECSFLARSYNYFEHLIEVFGSAQGFGPRQAWQVIRRAVTQMRTEHPESCSDIRPVR
jgi:hypothetical protein